jgi:hypothetical protein
MDRLKGVYEDSMQCGMYEKIADADEPPKKL